MSHALINPVIFRGYDIRGMVGTDLTPAVIDALGRAYATFLFRRRIRDVVVGMDIRESSAEYKDVFIRALVDAGLDVVDIGLSLSQIVYFAQYYYRAKGAAMVTASHNPREYNGLKLAAGFSETLGSAEIQELREIVETGQYKDFRRTGTCRTDDVFPAYQADILRRADVHGAAFNVVVDSISATTGLFLPSIIRQTGCRVIEQNTKPDGTFPLGTPDPTEQHHMARLSAAVIAAQADLGVNYDSDGDRVGFVDHTGQVIWNDVLVALFAQDVLSFLPGSPIIINTLCSKATIEAITAAGGQPVIWTTGHSFIKAKVRELRAPFGGELSGHFFFMDNFYGHDDGALATLRLIGYLTRTGQSLHQAVEKLPHYVSSPEIKVGLADDIKFRAVKDEIGQELKRLYPQAEYLEIDGVRVDTPNTMAIIRASQNGPYITIKFEGRTAAQYDQLKNQLRTILKANPHVDWTYGVNVNALE